MYDDLLKLYYLYETTNRYDIFNAVKNAFELFGGFVCNHVMVVIVGINIILVRLLQKYNINVPTIHCIIHQEALYGKIMKLDDVINTVLKISLEKPIVV